MPNYDEIIEQSHANVKALYAKLNELEELYQNILDLSKQPEIFDEKFQQVVKLSEEYTDGLGSAIKKYLEGNNTMFVEKLSELSVRSKELEGEISRLAGTDLAKSFEELQKIFIDQTRKDWKLELKKFDTKINDLHSKIAALDEQVQRIEKIDLEMHFDKLQKTLSEIFGAINSINITLTNITQSLTSLAQILGSMQTKSEKYFKETTHLINDFSETTFNHLTNQDKELKGSTELIENKINSLVGQIDFLKKVIRKNRIIQIIGITVIVIILIYNIFKW
nr:hypothetical protein [Bacteroidota bacterium]